MAWIESHTSLDKHHKVVRLRVAMRWSKNETIGFLQRFWWTVLEVSPSGDITALSSPEVLSEMLDMQVDVMAKALGFMIHEDPKLAFLEWKGGRLLVHDWLDYAGLYLSTSFYKRRPEKMAEIRALHGLPPDCPRTDQGQARDSSGTVLDTNQPTNQPDQPGEDAHARVGGMVLLGPEGAKANHERAKRILEAYPDKAKKDGSLIRKDGEALKLLAARVAAFPSYPWEEHARLERMNPTPWGLGKWAGKMPDQVALDALRKAAGRTGAPAITVKPAEPEAVEPLSPAAWAKVRESIRAAASQPGAR
jgi:hypothetical protein